jgi:hypothetical protein
MPQLLSKRINLAQNKESFKLKLLENQPPLFKFLLLEKILDLI